MNSFTDVIKKIVNSYIVNAKLTDLVIGTISKVNPIEVTMMQTMLPIPSECIYLTTNVIEKTIDDVKHLHQYFDSDTGEGASGSQTRSTQESLLNINVYENGVNLGHKDGKIIINKGLAVGDKVLMLRVKNGQRFVIISRIY